MKPDLEPDKAASKIPLLTFSRRLPTASFSPRPWLTIHHWMADPVQQLEKTSRVTLALGDVRAVRGLVLRSSQVHQLPLDGGKHGDPGAVEERRAPPCLPKSRQMGKGTGFGVSALGPAPPAEPPSFCGRRFSLQSLSLWRCTRTAAPVAVTEGGGVVQHLPGICRQEGLVPVTFSAAARCSDPRNAELGHRVQSSWEPNDKHTLERAFGSPLPES